MAKRVTQSVVETLYEPEPKGRITQSVTEALYLPTPKGRVTQAVVEVLYLEGVAPVTARPRFWAQVIG